MSTGMCKRKLDTAEVLTLYAISYTVALVFTQEQRSKLIGVHHLARLKIILSAALAVIKEVPGGLPDTTSKSQCEAAGGAGDESI
jgi:hypothetical protein